ncbi:MULTISPECIES: CPBP family intramembrane glutamic endopeptidase [unclassified Mycobacterium]|nr:MULTISPECIES: CPBP family intramembrane glutamic endopeptidase [unclassified Mycobacterium]
MRRASSLLLAAALVCWSFASPGLPQRWRPGLKAAVGGALALATRAPLGLRGRRLRAGSRLGAGVGLAAAGAIGVTALLAPVRRSMAARDAPASPAGWLLLRIPLGTVWAEEAAYRAALAHTASAGFGARGGRLVQATAFGLSHIPDARAAGEPVLGTLLVTGAAGWLFGWLADRSGSLAAPLLAHLAINEAGAVAALTARRLTG